MKCDKPAGCDITEVYTHWSYCVHGVTVGRPEQVKTGQLIKQKPLDKSGLEFALL